MVKGGTVFEAVRARIREMYGLRGGLMVFAGAQATKRKALDYADTVVLVTLDDPTQA